MVRDEPRSIGASYRDPSGFIFEVGGELLRHVSLRHREHFDRFIESGLYERLLAEDLIVPHEEVDPRRSTFPEVYRVLRPERVPFISYPYEWCFSELRDAALVTLRIQELALDHHMSLRDASAYNIAFHKGRAVFIDTTSFEILPEGRPWVAYGQFCEHFLAPLALMALRDPRLGLALRTYRDGIPLDLASLLLPWRANLRPSLKMHVAFHARTKRRHESDATSALERTAGKFSLNAFHGLIDSLRSAIDHLPAPPSETTWSGYYRDDHDYDAEGGRAKSTFVAEALDVVDPRTVWDLGSNAGRFAKISSLRGVETVAFDQDSAAVDAAYNDARDRQDQHFLPLVMDLVDPSPGLGFAGGERMSLEARGPADLVLALALVHHVAIGRNVPLRLFIEQLSRLGRSVLLEWVPKEDPRVQQLLRHREDVFAQYCEEELLNAIRPLFSVARRGSVDGTGRVLYLLTR